MDARWRSTARASSSVRDARQLCTSATVMNASEAPGACSRAGAVRGRGSRGRSRPSAAMLASIALDGGSAVASPRAGSRTSRFRSPSRNANWRSRLGRRDDSEVNATPWSQPSGTTGWDGTGRSVGGDATRARAESGVDALARVASGDDAGGETGAWCSHDGVGGGEGDLWVGEPRHCCGCCCLYVPRASCWKRSTRSRFCARSSVNQPMAPRPALCRSRRSLRSPRLGAPERIQSRGDRSVGLARAFRHLLVTREATPGPGRHSARRR